MLFTSSLKVTPLYLDGNYNGRSVALANLFESFHLLALRFAALVDSIFQHPSFSSPSSNGPKNGMFQFVSRVVEECRKKVLRRLRTADVLASGCQVGLAGRRASILFFRLLCPLVVSCRCPERKHAFFSTVPFLAWLSGGPQCTGPTASAGSGRRAQSPCFKIWRCERISKKP